MSKTNLITVLLTGALAIMFAVGGIVFAVNEAPSWTVWALLVLAVFWIAASLALAWKYVR